MPSDFEKLSPLPNLLLNELEKLSGLSAQEIFDRWKEFELISKDLKISTQPRKEGIIYLNVDSFSTLEFPTILEQAKKHMIVCCGEDHLRSASAALFLRSKGAVKAFYTNSKI